MPGFASPHVLWLVPLAAPLAWWWARRRRPALRYPDLRLVTDLPAGRAARARWGGALLRGAAFAGLVVAAAGPRTPDEQTRLPAEGISVVLVLDVSGSMTEKDAAWAAGEPGISRLDAAKRAFRLFVAGGDGPDGSRFEPREADAVGLVAFALVPQTVCPLTLNHSVLLRVADAQQPASGQDTGTNLGDAIAEGVIRLDRGGGDRPKVVVVLSDGEHNVSKQGDRNPLTPRQAAQLAANLGVKVYTIDAGGTPAADAPQESADQRAAGQAALRAVAEMTGGRSFAASSGAELLAAYREIGALEKRPVLSFQYRRYFDHAPWAAGLAAALLALAHLLDRTRWRVLP
jgi:Ca-activated chloride channel family protein